MKVLKWGLILLVALALLLGLGGLLLGHSGSDALEPLKFH